MAWLILPLGFLILLATFWVLAIRHLNARTQMVRQLDFDPGPQLRRSRWGSATINGVPAQNCVRVVEHADGWVIRMMPIFGGGKLWLRKERTSIGPIEPGSFLRKPSRRITCDDLVVILLGSLAAFFEEQP